MNAVNRWPIVCLGLALVSTSAPASTRVAIYAIVDELAFEPSDREPERVWISGVFVVPQPISSGLHQAPARGHLYFELNADDPDGTRADWQALRATAGTGQVVGFGEYWMPCSRAPSRATLGPAFPGSEDAACSFETAVDTTDRTRATPRPYPKPGEEGVVTVFDHSDDLCPRFGEPSVRIVANLREAHSPGSVRSEPPQCTEWIGLLASADLATAFRLQTRDAQWAESTESVILNRLADVRGLQLTDLSVQCRDTVCRIHLAFPSGDYQDTTGDRLAFDALRDLPGIEGGSNIQHGRDAPTLDYFIQRRSPREPTAAR